MTTLEIVFGGIFVLFLLIWLDLERRGCSKHLTWRQTLFFYFMRHLGEIKTYRAYKKFERNSRRFQEAQNEMLLDQIRRSEKTAYGRDNHFASIRNVEDFRRTQPVTDYHYVEPYVRRMVEGEKSALLGDEDELKLFVTSSGTTGKNKLLPISERAAKDMQNSAMNGPFQWTLRRNTGPWNLTRTLNMLNMRAPEYTKTGYLIGSVSVLMSFKMKPLYGTLYTSPFTPLELEHEFETLYLHLLFALRDKHITAIVAVFIFNFLKMIRHLEANYQDLVNDIRCGRIKEDLCIPDELRVRLSAKLTPMPDRADELQQEFSKGFKQIIPRIWPDINRVSALRSGSTNAIYYAEALEYLGNSIPVVSFTYSASEGFMGTNIDSMDRGEPTYTLLPDTVFYEFLPVVEDRIKDLEEIDRKDLLLSHQLEVGGVYEVFVTNKSGLYRSRIGDVVRVAGFHNQAPKVEFLYRAGQLLNVDNEKVSEEVFYRALRRAAQKWSSTLKDYTAAGSQAAPRDDALKAPHYLLFIELNGDRLSKEQTTMVEKMLREGAEEYDRFRKLGRIGEMAVYQVAPGTFAAFKDHSVKTTAVTSSQFKMPRVLKTRSQVEWFLNRVKPVTSQG